MQAKGKIGVIIPLVSAVEESNLLQGIHETAYENGYDVLVFTNSSNSQPEDSKDEAIAGEETIFSLLNHVKLDGILFCAGRFQNYRLRQRIAEIVKNLDIPVLSIEWNEGCFPSYTLSEKKAIKKLTSHLIEVHNCRKIYCLTGFEGIFESEDRMEGWKEALAEHGINPQKNWLFYGDFWKAKSQELARKIADSEVDLPDAVVCANDIMAVSLCEALKSYGIEVPKKIAVTGFDGDLLADISDPTITTVGGRNICFGKNATGQLIEMISGKKFVADEENVNITIGYSCGCHRTEHNHANDRYYDWVYERNNYKIAYLNCNYEMDMYSSKNLSELAEKISHYTYLIPKWNQIDICICDGWNGDSDYSNFKRTSYSDRMLLMFSQNISSEISPLSCFPTSYLLPYLQNEHEPDFVIIQPLHFQGNIFGYFTVHYKNGGDYFMDEHFLRWRNAISNSLEFLKKKIYSDYISKKLDEFSIREHVSGMLNKKGFQRNFSSVLEKIYESGMQAGIMLISWNCVSASQTAKVEKTGLLVAHALQLLCSENTLAARIQEQLFVVVFPIEKNEPIEDFETVFLFRIEKTLHTIQEKKSEELPELTAVSRMIAQNSDEIPEIDNLSNELYNKMKIYAQQHTNFSAALKSIRRQIRVAPENAASAEENAKLLGISESYFTRLFKKQFGVPYNDDVIHARLHKAKKLLRETDFSIKEISDRCGYSSTSYFMRQFKKNENITALEYRKKHRN